MKYLVLAETESEWDSCGLAIIDIDQEIIESIEKAKSILKDNPDWFGIEIEISCQFLSNDEYDAPFEEETDSFCELPDDFLASPVENKVKLTLLSVYNHSISIEAYGEHTGERFNVTSNIDDIINHFKSKS